MLSTSLTSTWAIVLCLATAASARGQVQAVKVLGPVKDAGVYHVATGTWIRNSGSKANLGPWAVGALAQQRTRTEAEASDVESMRYDPFLLHGSESREG